MPFRNTSVMGGSQGWQYDDQEKAAIDAKNRYGDQAARMYLAQMQSNDNRYNTDAQVGANRYSTDAQVAISGRQGDRAAQELNRFGSFDDNAQHDYAMGRMKSDDNLATATLQYGAGNKRADLEGRQYDDTRVATVAKAQAEAEKIQLRNALIKDYMDKARGNGQAGVPGAAPGAVPRSGMSDEEMFFMMNDGNPADLMKSRSEEKRYDRDRSDRQGEQQFALATTLLQSVNPQSRALGAQMMSQAKNSPVAGMPAGQLGQAFAPQRDAVEVLSSPTMKLEIEDLVRGINSSVTDNGSPEWNAKLEGIKSKAVSLGAPRDEVDAALMDMLSQSVDEPGFLSHPISSTIDAFLPGSPMQDNFSSESQKRKSIGLRPQR